MRIARFNSYTSADYESIILGEKDKIDKDMELGMDMELLFRKWFLSLQIPGTLDYQLKRNVQCDI